MHGAGGTPQISIHALREEGDTGASETRTELDRISIHALREEGDLGGFLFLILGELFLSTPSARRATYAAGKEGKLANLFLSTPSARRATRRTRRPAQPRRISIHALREEGDPLESIQ